MSFSAYHLTSAASLNLTSFGSMKLYGYTILNTAATARYVKFYWGAPGTFTSIAVPFGTGDGTTTAFNLGLTFAPAVPPLIYVNDWQGNQLQYSTPRTNLILQSSSLQTTPWVLDDATLAANSGTAPDGSNTAFLFNDKTDVTGQQHNLYSSTVGASGSVYKISIDAKEGTTPGIALGLYGNAQWDAYAYFDLSIGAVHSTGFQAGIPTITPLPEAGWYRCEITSVPLTGATGDTPYLRLLTPTWQEYYIGASLYNVYLQNAQVSPTDGSYIPTTSAAVTQTDYSQSGTNINFSVAPANGAALTYVSATPNGDNPTVGTDIPLLTVEVPANSIVSQSYMQGIGNLGNMYMATTVNPADTDATAVSAGDLIISLGIG